MTSPDTGTRAVRAAVISWVVLIPLLSAGTAAAGLLTGPAAVLLFLGVVVTFLGARAVLTVFARLGPGVRRQILMALIAAALALPLIAGTAVYLTLFGQRVDAVVSAVVDPTTRVLSDPATGRELGRVVGPDSELGPATVGQPVPVLAAPGLPVDPVPVGRASFGRYAAGFWLVGWVAGGALIIASFAKRRREAAGWRDSR
jgi:hypothetical protein